MLYNCINMIILLGHHTDCGPMGIGQYNSLGEYCGLSTDTEVFLILLDLPYTEQGHIGLCWLQDLISKVGPFPSVVKHVLF